MRQPKDYPVSLVMRLAARMGRSAQIRYAQTAVSVIVLVCALFVSGYYLATAFLEAARSIP